MICCSSSISPKQTYGCNNRSSVRDESLVTKRKSESSIPIQCYKADREKRYLTRDCILEFIMNMFMCSSVVVSLTKTKVYVTTIHDYHYEYYNFSFTDINIFFTCGVTGNLTVRAKEPLLQLLTGL